MRKDAGNEVLGILVWLIGAVNLEQQLVRHIMFFEVAGDIELARKEIAFVLAEPEAVEVGDLEIENAVDAKPVTLTRLFLEMESLAVGNFARIELQLRMLLPMARYVHRQPLLIGIVIAAKRGGRQQVPLAVQAQAPERIGLVLHQRNRARHGV